MADSVDQEIAALKRIIHQTWMCDSACSNCTVQHYLEQGMDWFMRSRPVRERDLAHALAAGFADHRSFEEWLVDRWLKHVQSEEFRASADYHYLHAEWEREMGETHAAKRSGVPVTSDRRTG